MKNANFYSLFEFSPVPMWVFDVETLAFLDVNLAAASSYGFTKEEFLHMTIRDIRPKEDIPLIEAIVTENVISGKYFRKVFQHLKKDGTVILVEIESNKVNYNERDARIVLATNVTDKLTAEYNLQKSEQRFRALVQDATDMITIIDRNFDYKYVSPASKRVFGVEPLFFIGRNAFQYIHPDDLKIVELEAQLIWSNKKIQLSPYRYKDIQGNWLWIETCATNLLDDPSVEGIVCTSKDITDRLAAEKIIHENIERYNIVSKATSDVIWDCDFEQNTIIWNKAIKGILKYSVHQTTTYDWWKERIHPDDREKVIDNLNQHIVRKEEKWEDEYRFLCGDGHYKYIYDRGFLLLNEDGEPSRMIGAMQDISKRKEEEQWSKLLESVVINTSDGVLITDASPYPGPLIVYVNAALQKMSGFSEKELIGSPPSILHGPHKDQPELKILADAVRNEQECTVELVNYTKDGEPFNVSITICPVTDAKGQLCNWISIQRDITKQKEYVKAIEDQNARLKSIRWLQSHGVRAPLARIMSLVELISANNSSEEEKKELMKFLLISAEELDTIVTAIANDTPREPQLNDVK